MCFQKRGYVFPLKQYFEVTQYLGCMARLFIYFKSFTHPKILGARCDGVIHSPFLKIYGDGPALSKIRFNPS
jgi:hypothetical protein